MTTRKPRNNKMSGYNIEFKSTPEYWRKEYLGLKPNTLREYGGGGEDIRFELLNKWVKGTINILTITMINSKTGERFFRRVSDVTVYKGWWIISWRHAHNDTNY